MPHPDISRLEASFDAEIDALSMRDIERHLDQCGECRRYLDGLERTRRALRRDLAPMTAPPALRERVMRALDRESRSPRLWRSRPVWIGALGGGLVTALAASLALVVWMPRPDAIVDELVGAHLGALISGHLIDVVSSDRHTVKPWFAGHADVSPLVVDLAAEGYRLNGGRVDYVDRRRAAVVVYQHGPHVVDVFTWSGAARDLPRSTMRNGYRLMCWRSQDLDNCAVSDTAAEELRGLVRLLQERGAGDPRE